MKDLNNILERYADMTVELGANVTPDRYCLITCPTCQAEFGRMLAERAWKRGARDVIVNWYDEKLERIKYDNAPLSVFEALPAWQAESRNFYAREGCCNIVVIADDPEVFTGAPQEKLTAKARAAKKAYKEFYDVMDAGNIRWSIVACPNEKWAMKMFPGVAPEEAVEKQWDAILSTVRIDGDYRENWEKHDRDLKSRAEKLNKAAFSALRYTNSLGTDFTVGLAKGHIWLGGSDQTPDGTPYFPNIPTEEIFTMPDRLRADGVVCASMPLSYRGTLVENFSFTFKDGKVVDFSAEKGADAIKGLLDTDEGSRSLGEVALIPYDSPISNMGLLFYETLFDENASCHLALGDSYPNTLAGGEKLSDDELLAAGGNRSVNHVDFMVGTADLSIDGITEDGKAVPVFRNGSFVI